MTNSTPTPAILIRNGRIIDPASGTDAVLDVAIQNGRIADIGRNLSKLPASETIDAEGCIVAPGLIDPHVHLREPGGEEAETIATGAAAAVAGGFTTVCCMPNTTPTLDDDSMIEFIFKQAELAGMCRVFPVGAVSKGRRGEELAEIGLMRRAGAVGFSDDGDVVASAGLMAKALAYIKPIGLALMQHCQEPTLTVGASMHAGQVSARLGLGGWPRVAEEMIIERDVRLNRGVGCRYHVQHLSCAGSVDIIRRARAEGQPVSAEASPHHLLLTDECIEAGPDGGGEGGGGPRLDPKGKPCLDAHRAVDAARGGPVYWANAKMNPPLREQSDIAALKHGVADGTITILATDHAPHTAERKALEFEAAPFGIIGLETALGLYIRALIDDSVIGWPRLIAMMTIEPARLCGLDAPPHQLGSLTKGGPADVTVIDPAFEWTVSESDLAGRSRNTPFIGWSLRGRAVATVVGGQLRMQRLGNRAAVRA